MITNNALTRTYEIHVGPEYDKNVKFSDDNSCKIFRASTIYKDKFSGCSKIVGGTSGATFGKLISRAMAQGRIYCIAIVEFAKREDNSQNINNFFITDAINYIHYRELFGHLYNPRSGQAIVQVHLAMLKNLKTEFQIFAKITVQNNKIDFKIKDPYAYNIVMATKRVDIKTQAQLEPLRQNLINQLFEILKKSLGKSKIQLTTKISRIDYKEIEKNYNHLIYWLEASIQDFPKNIDFCLQLASVYSESIPQIFPNYVRATQCFEKAIFLDPERMRTYMCLSLFTQRLSSDIKMIDDEKAI